jgi:hypothetical protein
MRLENPPEKKYDIKTSPKFFPFSKKIKPLFFTETKQGDKDKVFSFYEPAGITVARLETFYPTREGVYPVALCCEGFGSLNFTKASEVAFESD